MLILSLGRGRQINLALPEGRIVISVHVRLRSWLPITVGSYFILSHKLAVSYHQLPS